MLFFLGEASSKLKFWITIPAYFQSGLDLDISTRLVMIIFLKNTPSLFKRKTAYPLGLKGESFLSDYIYIITQFLKKVKYLTLELRYNIRNGNRSLLLFLHDYLSKSENNRLYN